MKFGDVYRRRSDDLTVMLLVPGTDSPGIQTDEMVRAHNGDHVVLTLDQGVRPADFAPYWPLLRTAMWVDSQVDEWELVE